MKRQLWRALPALMFGAGALLAASPLLQNGFAWWNQRALLAAWQKSALEARHARPATRSAGARPAAHPRSLPANDAAKVAAPVRAWPATRLLIPDIGLDAVVVQGADTSALRRGPGHVPTTALPGEAGNCAIAGHNNIYGSPFARLNELPPSSLILLRTPQETFRYRTLTLLIVNDTDTSVIGPSAPGGSGRLTLITCTVPHSWQRVVLVAEREQPGVPY